MGEFIPPPDWGPVLWYMYSRQARKSTPPKKGVRIMVGLGAGQAPKRRHRAVCHAMPWQCRPAPILVYGGCSHQYHWAISWGSLQ